MRIEKEKISLCPNCKIGYDSVKLDPKEPFCPYISLHTGESCSRYVPLNIITDEGDKKLTEK